jgi:penicillin-insensitive murein endopeptidase
VRPAHLAIAALTATVTLATGAFPGASSGVKAASNALRTASLTGPSAARLGPAALRFGRSIGSPTEGHLLGGAHLTETDYLRVMPADTAGDVRWGLEPLVSMVDRAARTVRREFPQAIGSVGHLSREGGGDIDRHRSHESGRDADVGFYIRSATGRQLLPSHFVSFRGDGTASSWPGAYFDDAKNWALVRSLITDPQAHVTHLFIAAPLRGRLLAYAERTGAPSMLRVRAAELMQQPRGVLPHDDHFHVRIGCPAHMSGCVENPAARVERARPSRNSASALSARDARTPHDHRDAPVHGLVTAAPKRAAAAPANVAPVAPLPEPAVPGKDDPPRESDAPPASLTVPIDDVDG